MTVLVKPRKGYVDDFDKIEAVRKAEGDEAADKLAKLLARPGFKPRKSEPLKGLPASPVFAPDIRTKFSNIPKRGDLLGNAATYSEASRVAGGDVKWRDGKEWVAYG